MSFFKSFSAARPPVASAPAPSSPPPPYSASPASPYMQNQRLPDLMAVIAKGSVTIDEYMTLHQIATSLDEQGDLRVALMQRDRLVKFLVISLFLALFLPSLFSLLLSLAVLGLVIAYFMDIEPFKSQIAEIVASVSMLLSTGAGLAHQAVQNHQNKRKALK